MRLTMTMKKTFVALGACALFTLPACKAALYDPITGNPWFEGEIEDNPTPERARELFAQLEEGLKRNLEALREARRTANEQAQNLCIENMERAAEHKQQLTAMMNG